MARKRTLVISDIQDEVDIHDRLVIKQQKAKKKSKLSGNSRLLSDQVERVDAKREGLGTTRKVKVKPVKLDHLDDFPEDEQPVVVESDELRLEKSIDGIPNVELECKDIVLHYADLQLLKIFGNDQDNFNFRLFVSAASFGMLKYLQFPQDTYTLYVSVLRDIVSKRRAKEDMKGKYVREKSSSLGSEKEEKPKKVENAEKLKKSTGSGGIVRTFTKISVPKRILRLLEEV